MFRKYSCDCIGFEITDEETGEMHAYCVQACDDRHSDGELGLWLRPELMEKPCEPLPFPLSTELIEELSGLVSDGYRFRTVRSSLLAADQAVCETTEVRVSWQADRQDHE